MRTRRAGGKLSGAGCQVDSCGTWRGAGAPRAGRLGARAMVRTLVGVRGRAWRRCGNGPLLGLLGGGHEAAAVPTNANGVQSTQKDL